MKNPRVTKKEQGLIKGALRRVFSRSDLRKAALAKNAVPYFFYPRRPLVKNWTFCGECGCIEPKSTLEVDHLDPVIKIQETLDMLTPTELVNRLWCELELLDPKCSDCHLKKTQEENKARREFKKAVK